MCHVTTLNSIGCCGACVYMYDDVTYVLFVTLLSYLISRFFEYLHYDL